MIHELKILSEFFDEVLFGKKTFEVRYDDRGYQVGDVLILKEINRDDEGSYTGREIAVDVTYIYRGDYCKNGYCIMSIQKRGEVRDFVRRNDFMFALVKVAQCNGEDEVRQVMNSIPAADVKEVRYGKWEEVSEYNGWGDTHYRCSVCGEEWYLEDGTPEQNEMYFCPRCGSRMKEGTLDEDS